MPKDLIHFKVAERTARTLKDTRFAAALDACPHGLLLGSVFHDALFYGATPAAKRLEQLPHTLHGANGEDTFSLLRLQAHHAAQTNSPLAIALLTGMVSHVFADVAMHPLVWFLTGDYYTSDPAEKSRARQRHRALESLMDMVACPEMLGRARYSLRVMLRRTGTDLYDALPLEELGTMAEISATQTRTGIRSAWRVFAGFQSLYPVQSLSRTLHAMLPWMPRPAAEITALFYAPQLMEQKDRLTGDIPFTHPLTGEDQTARLDELIDEAADKASRFCLSLETAIFDGEPVHIKDTGPSMDTGFQGVNTHAMTHYAHTPFPELPQSKFHTTRLPRSPK